MTTLSEQIANEVLYGKDPIIITDSLIENFLAESSNVQGVYSDEGLYDFFSSFDAYKKITKSKAAKILGWPIVDYVLNKYAKDPVYDVSMMDDQRVGVNRTTRADMVTYGGAVVAGTEKYKVADAKYQVEMEQIAQVLGWEIVKWMGIGPNRKSQVVIIPSYKQTTMKAKVNEDIAIGITFNEDVGIIPSPSRKNVKKAASRKDRSIYIQEEESRIEKVIAVYPGRFQPFGPHHKKSYDFLKRRFDEVYIVTSNKTGGARHPMSFSEKKKHMQKMGIPSSAIQMESQPYMPKKLLNRYDENTTAVVFGVGAKDGQRLSGGKYFKDYRKNYMRLKGYGEHGYKVELPHTSVKVGGQEISGTTMRKLLGSDDYDLVLRKKFFKKMFGYFDQKTFDLFISVFQEQVIRKKELLLMGGAYGHMAHPFDDYGLTFGDLKQIIRLGLQGKLDKEEGITEKLDGQNLMVSVVDGKAKAARNKGNIKQGGMSLDDVKNKFKNHIPAVRNAFVYAMTDLKSTLERMSKKDQDVLFDNGNNWANLEIIYSPTKNVIDYDGPATIIFHGILKYDTATAAARGEVRSGGSKLASIISKINSTIETKFSFKGPNVLKVAKAKDYSAKQSKFLTMLTKLQNKYKLSDSDEVSLYHQHFWLEYILAGAHSTDFASIPDNVLYPLMKRWAFDNKTYKLTELNKLKPDHPDFVDWARTTDKIDKPKILKNNMKPFETLFFQLGAEILSNVSNWLAPNPSKTAQSLRSDLDKAVKQIKNSKDLSAIGKLKTQLNKIKAMGGLDTIVPSEGLVFKYNGKIFKFTGIFAPINQITGLMKFSR